MNNSVAAGNDRPDDFQAVAAVREVHLAPLLAVVAQHEPEQRHFGADEHDARQPEDEIEQVVDRVPVLRDIDWQPVLIHRRKGEAGHAQHGHQQEHKAQNFPTAQFSSLTASAGVACDCCTTIPA